LRPYFASAHGGKAWPGQPQQPGGSSLAGGGGLEEGEGRGPLKEFLQLVGAQICTASTSTQGRQSHGTPAAPAAAAAAAQGSALFAYHQGSEALWFERSSSSSSSSSAQPEPSHRQQLWSHYAAAGVLLGASVAARCALGVNIAPLLARLLLLDDPPQTAPTSDSQAQGAAATGEDSGEDEVMAFDAASPLPSEAAATPHLAADTAASDDAFMQHAAAVLFGSGSGEAGHGDQAATSATLATLRQFDPELAAAAQSTLQLDDHEWSALANVEGLAPGTSRGAYVSQLAQELILTPVSEALLALRAGFRRALPPRWLREVGIGAAELCELMRGHKAIGGDGAAADFSWREVFRVVEDEELLAEQAAPLREALWAVMEARLSPAQKRDMLHFLTGVRQLPAPRTESLAVELPFEAAGIEEQRAALRLLPQAHTCTNTLELPNYWRALREVRAAEIGEIGEIGGGSLGAEEAARRSELEELMLEKFLWAIGNSGGYGLD
jgi:hypothetical protein